MAAAASDGLYSMLIDVHCHPFEPEMDQDTGAVMARAAAAGVGAAVAAGTTLATSRRVVALAGEVPGLVAAVGLHPWFLTDAVGGAPRPAPEEAASRAAPAPLADALAELVELARDGRVVALGEIGLDKEVAVPLALQREVFRAQLGLARELGLPVVIHSRHTVEAVLAELRLFPGLPCLLHSFGGSLEQAAQLVARGCYFSFSGSVTRPRARRLHALARALPPERILLETDAPAIGLEGVDAAAVEPRHLPLIARFLAFLRMTPTDELAAQTSANALRLFGARLDAALDRTPGHSSAP